MFLRLVGLDHLIDWDNDGVGDNTIRYLMFITRHILSGIIDQNQPSCRKDTCFIITEPDSIVVNLIGITEISCADSINGALHLPAGGTIAADYQFDWDIDGTGDNDDSEDISSLEVELMHYHY